MTNAAQTRHFQPDAPPRRVFIIFSTRNLPYARICIQGLLANVITPIVLHLIVDSPEEVTEMQAALPAMDIRKAHEIKVVAKPEIDAIAATRFAAYPNLQAFREGHPCWRKITDPYLLSEAGDDIVILDPDLFFPNPFAFEPQPDKNILLMYQGPNCLLPFSAVRQAFDADIEMADHVDIGAAYAPTVAFDLPWLDTLLGTLEIEKYSRYMHIEAIVWAAMAMRGGGAYLESTTWRCWQRGYLKRVLIAAGASGPKILKLEPLANLKCLHVSGPSKYWMVEALADGRLSYTDNLQDQPTRTIPMILFHRSKFERLVRLKRILYGAVGKRPPL